jgi:hypothetical protein
MSAEPDVNDPCDTCSKAEWGTRIPLPGVLITAYEHIECCDNCGVYESDFDAAVALANECRERGLSDRIRCTIDGYDVE